MKVQEVPTTDGPDLARGPRPSRERWKNTLLVAAVLMYGGAVVLLMSMSVSSVLGWWLLGTVIGLVVLGFLVASIPAHLRLHAPRQARDLPDPWAEEWEHLIRRAVR